MTDTSVAKQIRHYFDLDGVIVQLIPDASLEDMLRPGYFLNLKPVQPSIDALNYLVEKGENVFIISKVLSNEAAQEKDEWLDRYQVNIPKDKRIYVSYDEEKSSYVAGLSKSDILYDDYSKNLIEWTEAGGTAVKILNGMNGKGSKFTGARIRIETPSTLYHSVHAL